MQVLFEKNIPFLELFSEKGNNAAKFGRFCAQQAAAGLVLRKKLSYNRMKFNGVVLVLSGLLSAQTIISYALRVLVMLITIPFHESAHALVSHWLGDDTAKNAGRLSLNPMRHFDPLGALCMVLAGVGWAKPVGINPRNYKNPKVGMAVSAAAGPLSNLLLGWVSYALLKVVTYSGLYLTGFGGYLALLLQLMTRMNITLAVFNLIPVPPFDGSRIMLLFLPQRLYFKAMQYERYMMLAVLALVFFGLLNTPLAAATNWVVRGMDALTLFVDVAFQAAWRSAAAGVGA